MVTLHAAPTAENREIVDARALARMKPTAILVNTGRGWLVDYDALKHALESGAIGGGALDVYERDPPDPSDPLFSLTNFICTLHVADWTFDGMQNVGWHGARNLWAMVSGEGHADVINPEARRSKDAGSAGPTSAGRVK